MSVESLLVRVTPEQLERLDHDSSYFPSLIGELVGDSWPPDDPSEPAGPAVYISEWSRSLLGGWDDEESPVFAAIFWAGASIGVPDRGAADVSAHAPDRVRELAAALGSLSVEEILRRFDSDPARYLPHPDTQRPPYPTDEDGVRWWAVEKLARVRELYEAAAAAGDAVLVAIV